MRGGIRLDKLTLQEASEYSGRSVSWIRKKILSGEMEASKEQFKYGERWKVTKEELDRVDKTAKTTKEVVEVNRSVDKEEMINSLVEATDSRFKRQIEKATSNIINKIESQKQAIDELKQSNKRLEDNINKLQKEEKEKLKDIMENMEDIKKMQRENQEKNKSIFMQFFEWLYY